MNFFAGVTSGFGEAQGKYNQKMVDLLQEKHKTMASMYAHLADQAENQDVASELVRRSFGWAGANPFLDPKGYKEIVKGEKLSLHDLVDQAYQKKVSEHNQSLGGNAGEAGGAAPPTQVQAQSAAPSAPEAPSTPQPPSPAMQVAPAPTNTSFSHQRVPESPEDAGFPPPAPTMSSQPTPPPMAAQGQGQSQISAPPTQQPSQAAQGPSMDEFVKSGLPPEPPMYGAMGRITPEWKLWHDLYQKKMEGTVQTPQGMRDFVGKDFMPSGLAPPYANMMRGELTADARAHATGYKLDRATGQFVPLRPEEESLMTQMRQTQLLAQTQLAQATIPLRQMMTQLAGVKAKLVPIEMQALLRRLDIAQQNANNLELRTHALTDGIDPATGKPFPGALAVSDGAGGFSPVGTLFNRGVLPTAATQGKAESSIPVMEQANQLYTFATNPDNSDLFGKYSGNLADFIARKTGTNDPRETLLRGNLISLASLMVPLHGFRSQKAAEEFLGRLAQGNSPEAFASAVRGFNATGMFIYSNGMPKLFDGGGNVGPRMEPPNGPLNPKHANHTNSPPHSRFSIGQVFSKGNKKYKVTKVNADGGVDTVEVP